MLNSTMSDSMTFDEGPVDAILSLAQYRTYKPYHHVAKYSSFSWTCIPMHRQPNSPGDETQVRPRFAMSSNTKQRSWLGNLSFLLSQDKEKASRLCLDLSLPSVVRKLSRPEKSYRQMILAQFMTSERVEYM